MEFLAIIYYYPASNTVSVIIYALNEWREPNIFGVYDCEVQKELATPFFWILGSLMNEQSWITSILYLHFKLQNISMSMTLLIWLQLMYMIYLLQIDSATWQHIPLRVDPNHGLYIPYLFD